MISKPFLFSFAGSLIAHGSIVAGLGLHSPAQISVPVAPTAMELIISVGREENAAALPIIIDVQNKKQLKTDKESVTEKKEVQSVILRKPKADEESEIRSNVPPRAPQDDTKSTLQDDTGKKAPRNNKEETRTQPSVAESKPIPGTDIGSIQVGTTYKTHGACIAENPPPIYPRAARRNGAEGRTLLLADISVKGKAKSVSLLSSSGHTLLDQAAIKAVKKWTFIVARRLGIPVESQLQIPIVFQIKD